MDEAANDVRDKVARVRGRLPPEVDDPQISKADSDSDPVISLSFSSEVHSRLELTELVERLVVQRLQTIPGVAAVELRGLRVRNATVGRCHQAGRVQPHRGGPRARVAPAEC
jgi:multidrug efflux pump